MIVTDEQVKLSFCGVQYFEGLYFVKSADKDVRNKRSGYVFGFIDSKLNTEYTSEELKNLLSIWKKASKNLKFTDDVLSFSAFVAVLINMTELFLVGYRTAFHVRVSQNYFLPPFCFGTYNLSLQLLIMVPALNVNESSKNVKNSLERLKLQFHKDKRENIFDFGEHFVEESNLTLWKIYIMDRPLIITSLGTLITYGIMLGTLGKQP
ncbi:hypothetical protein HNY73_015154 [Argiope bruennichi]|uniref:Uncharacterized protein n=1 Tax=Argiope bruennichi TaxID=94029 RepID=A0A8T0ERH1_ARGBR|nr:hypothetical protein HNY73_015154 [Argiope bruennichi]